MNRVSLVGRLTAKPELRYTNSQVPFTRFTVAVNRNFSNAQGQREADFIGVIAWRKQAEIICNYLDKGSLVSVDGRIQTGSYDDKDGKRIYTFDVVSDNIQFLESKSQAQSRKSSEDYGNNNSNNFGNSPYDYQENNNNNNNQGFNLGNADDAYVNMGDIVTLDDADEID